MGLTLCYKTTVFNTFIKLIALYAANAYSAEREMSASACTRSMTGFSVLYVVRHTTKNNEYQLSSKQQQQPVAFRNIHRCPTIMPLQAAGEWSNIRIVISQHNRSWCAIQSIPEARHATHFAMHDVSAGYRGYRGITNGDVDTKSDKYRYLKRIE